MKLGIVGMFLLLLIILISGSFFGNLMREGFVEKSSTLTKQIGDMAVIQSGMPQQSGVLGNADPDYNVNPQAIYNYLKQRGDLRIDNGPQGSSDMGYNEWLQSRYSKQGGSLYSSVVGNRIPQDYLDSGSNSNTFSGDGGYGGGASFDPSELPDTSPQSTLPRGIPKSQIPPGKEDMYIAKSQVVAPVCPECPPMVSGCKKPCPPCPECAPCPDQPIRCKKVPNYNSKNNRFIPRAVLTNFSTFGM